MTIHEEENTMADEKNMIPELTLGFETAAASAVPQLTLETVAPTPATPAPAPAPTTPEGHMDAADSF